MKNEREKMTEKVLLVIIALRACEAKAIQDIDFYKVSPKPQI